VENVTEVEMARLKIEFAPNKLAALGIGSCIVITFYDPKRQIGALAHTMLPESKGQETVNPLKFADKAIDAMLKEMGNLGSKKDDIEAKIVGGANMFPDIHGPADIGESNIKAIEKKLKKEGVKLVGKDTRGTTGRSVELDCATGIVSVNIKI